MAQKEFWEIIISDEDKSFEILGKTFDDIWLTNKVVEMQHAGISIRCDTPSSDHSKKRIIRSFESQSYSYKEGLFRELKKVYQKKS